MNNDFSNNNQNDANSISPLSGPTSIYPNNTDNQQNGNSMNSGGNDSSIQQLVQQLVSEIQKQSGNSNPMSSSAAQEYARRNTTRYSDSNGRSGEGDYDYFEVEQKIVKEIQQIRLHADEYGPITEVVGRRAVITRGESRGNGYEFEYKLADGRIVTNDQCWELANAGRIKNVIGSHNHGRKYVRSVGDGVLDNNNLGNLPGF